MVYNFNYEWKFMLADAFPLAGALDKHRDGSGRYFYEPEYSDGGWDTVSVPHTFNDGELFSTRIEDGGAMQTRTFAFYRKRFDMPAGSGDKKVIIEFEGIRQSCFLYVNGRMAGFYENGVAPFGFDITKYIVPGKSNLIAVATDNTSTRNVDVCMAETPNKPDIKPGSCVARLKNGTTADNQRSVGFFWNCNDFNPSVGGLTKNIRLHIKPMVYLTLPLYTNLKTAGTYIYADNFSGSAADINILAEIRNESGETVRVRTESTVIDRSGNEVLRIVSAETETAPAALPDMPPLTITPGDAYIPDGNGGYIPQNDESRLRPTEYGSEEVSVIRSAARGKALRLWNIDTPYLYTVKTTLFVNGAAADTAEVVTGFRKTDYSGKRGMLINGEPVWLTGYAQRSANEWAAIGAAPDWVKDFDARLIRESNANHIRWMHVAACPADIRACDRYGIVCTQPAGDKERENFGRQWRQRVELMRDVIIYFRNSPSIFFWEVGNNAVNAEHMREMRLLKQALDPCGGRYIGCRTIHTPEVVAEAEYVGTMLNRHAGRFQSELMPILETEYLREESPRRVWDDFSPPDYDYDNVWAGAGGIKQQGIDVHDLTAEEFALRAAAGYSEFFNDRMGGASGKNLYSSAAALCWTDSAQHGRQSGSENARMSGRVDAARVKKESFEVFRVMQSGAPAVKLLGHWSYPKEGGDNYRYPVKRFNGRFWEKTGEYALRDPRHKTVYAVGSYPVAKIELYINSSLVGVCQKPEHSFIFPFPDIDITQPGCIEARAYGYDGFPAASDVIETAGEPYAIRLTMHTGERGFLADGSDIVFFDVEVTDREGRICPLCFRRIDFILDGAGIFLGGYNSGRYDGFGKSDSVIHKNHVYAECGTNRVFIRAAKTPGRLKLTARMDGVKDTTVEFSSQPADAGALSHSAPARLEYQKEGFSCENSYAFEPIPAADAAKYTSVGEDRCKVLVDADEADLHGKWAHYINGAVYGPIIYFLDRVNRSYPGKAEYDYDPQQGRLVIKSGGNTIELVKGHTHMLVNGAENLLGGEPEIDGDGVMIAEISAAAPFLENAHAHYDADVSLYKVEFK